MKWPEYHQSLVRRGEMLLGFDVIGNWHQELQKVNKGKVGKRPFRYPNTFLLLLGYTKAYFICRTGKQKPIPQGQQNLPPPASQSSAGLFDVCLQSGFTQAQCNNMLLRDDPGGYYCSTLNLAGVPCPKIQDPAFTYGNPKAAEEQSRKQIDQTQRAIEGFNQAVPDNLGRGFVIE